MAQTFDISMLPEIFKVAAPVNPDGGPSVPVSAASAPAQSKGGIMGALGRIFTPEAGTFWDSAWKNGLMGAKAGQQAYQQGQQTQQLGIQTQEAANAKSLADAERLRRQSRYGVAGNNVIDYGDGTSQPNIIAAPVQSTETERLIDRWHDAVAKGDKMTAMILERAIKGYQYSSDYVTADTGRKATVKRTTPGKAPSTAKPTTVKVPGGFVLE